MIAFQDRRPPTPLPALPIPPLAEVEIPPAVAALPKADVHVHAESGARLEQVIAQQTGRPGIDWRTKARELMRDLPPGMARLETWVAGLPYSRSWVDEVDRSPGYLEARIGRVLVEAAADGALLVEVMFGALTILRDDSWIGLPRRWPRCATASRNSTQCRWWWRRPPQSGPPPYCRAASRLPGTGWPG